MLPLPLLIATLLPNEPLRQKALNLNKTGIIKSIDSYYYLKIDDDYINDLFQLIDDEPFLQKPDYFSGATPTGAHVTIAYNDEDIVVPFADLETEHTFDIEQVYHVTLGPKEYFVLFISAPSLEKIRIRHGLPAKPIYKGHTIDFHITIAIRLRTTS